MKILVDTNIILDVLLKREPHNKAAQVIMTKCAERMNLLNCYEARLRSK